MPRPGVVLLTTVLAILTAVTLLRSIAVVSEAGTGASPAERTKAVAREFYAALNQAIHINDSAALARVASPELVVHRASGPGEDRKGLETQIAKLRAAFPALQFVVDDLIADRDRAFARVRLVDGEGAGSSEFLAGAAPGSSFTDTLRVRAGRVVEYAGLAADLNVPRHVLHETFDAAMADSARVALTRLMLEPGAGFRALVSPGPTVYAVEAGRVFFQSHDAPVALRSPVESTPAPSSPIAPDDAILLAPGEQIAMEAGVAHAFHAADTAPAIVVALILMTPHPVAATGGTDSAPTSAEPLLPAQLYLTGPLARQNPGWPDGETSQLLVGGFSMPLPRSPFEIAIERVTLAPGSVVAGHRSDRIEILAVRDGSALFATTRQSAERDVAAITGGSAALLHVGTVSSVQNAGDVPLVLLLLSLAPTDGPATLLIPAAVTDQACTPGNPFCVGP